jgi:(heptosyl)LPS beta-1,4-glucosyltransferase
LEKKLIVLNKLSVIIITFNEERNIKRCLTSVIDIADEIIVVDSFSKDATEDICKSFTKLKFVQKEWQGYSETKNHANSIAENDYIFSIDADEALSEELKESIKKQKEEGLSYVYQMNRMTNYCGRWIKYGSWYPDRKIRIWNRNLGQWQGEIHEKINFQNEYQPFQLQGDLQHYSYYNVEEHYAQIEKFTSLSALELFNRGKRGSVFKIFFSPIAKFIKDYVFLLGFLDGKAGFRIACLSAKATALKYKKLRKRHKA